MTRGVGGFIKIDDTRTNVLFEVAFERSTASWDRCKVSSSNEYYNNLVSRLLSCLSFLFVEGKKLTIAVVAQQQRPIRSINGWSR